MTIKDILDKIESGELHPKTLSLADLDRLLFDLQRKKQKDETQKQISLLNAIKSKYNDTSTSKEGKERNQGGIETESKSEDKDSEGRGTVEESITESRRVFSYQGTDSSSVTGIGGILNE